MRKNEREASKFNYRFRNNTGVELVENEPAYKRQGVELNDTQHSSENTLSNLKLNQNQDGELELKSRIHFYMIMLIKFRYGITIRNNVSHERGYEVKR